MSFFKTLGKGLTAGLPGAIFGMASSLFTQGAEKKAATSAFQRQKDLFDYQAAYNTPANQIKRLKDAGLNPALMYGKGTMGNVEGMPSVQKANVTGPDLAQSAAVGAQLSLVNAQKNKLQEEADLIRNQQVLTNANAIKAVSENLKIQADKAKVIQETLNLKTGGDILEFEKAVKSLEALRAEKGILKGDTIGNILSILNLDPINNPGDRQLIQIALGAYFGASVADKFIKALTFNKFKKGGK